MANFELGIGEDFEYDPDPVFISSDGSTVAYLHLRHLPMLPGLSLSPKELDAFRDGLAPAIEASYAADRTPPNPNSTDS